MVTAGFPVRKLSLKDVHIKIVELLSGMKVINKDGIDLVPYEAPLVEAVDAIVKFAKYKGCGKTIEREVDWEVVRYIFEVWCVLYPDYAKGYLDHMKQWRLLSNKHGGGREGEAHIQHTFNLPEKLYEMIESIFPFFGSQLNDIKFARKFANKMPQFRGSDTL